MLPGKALTMNAMEAPDFKARLIAPFQAAEWDRPPGVGQVSIITAACWRHPVL